MDLERRMVRPPVVAAQSGCGAEGEFCRMGGDLVSCTAATCACAGPVSVDYTSVVARGSTLTLMLYIYAIIDCARFPLDRRFGAGRTMGMVDARILYIYTVRYKYICAEPA